MLGFASIRFFGLQYRTMVRAARNLGEPSSKFILKREAIVAVVTVTGTNGAEGEPGGAAVANAATAADATNTATATGGNGGDAGFDSGQNAGSGGNAQATATTTLQSSGATSATATATGGNGGSGIYNEPGGAGAPGGSATASAEDTGAANATAMASATGGAGGYGAGGGVASGVTAYASGTASALASAEQTGGNSGGGRYSASPGVSSTLTNAVGGETDDGSLTLEQTAVGGAGAYSELSASSDGGAATSSLAFDDTQNATQSASLTVDVSAAGGAGGAGYDGGGGDATASATITGASLVSVTVGAVGGAGGGGDGSGSGGAATATADVTSTSGSATADVSATGGAGGASTSSGSGGAALATGDATSAAGLATADVTATGGDGGYYEYYNNGAGGSANATSEATGASVSSTAVAQGGQGGGSGLALASGASASGTISASASSGEIIGSGVDGPMVLGDSASASGVVSGSASAEASTSIGGDSPSFVTGEQAVALVAAEPDTTSIDAVTDANSNIATAFAASPTYFGIAELGGAATTAVTDAQTISDDVQISDSVFLASGDDLVLGLYGGAATGVGFSNLTLTVSVNDQVELTQSFASLAALGDYFANNAVAVSSLPSGASTLNLDVSLSMTTSTAGSSYDFGVLIGAAPESPPTITGAVADQMITDEQTDTLFSGVTIGDVDNGTTETLTVTLSDALNGTLSNLGGGAYNAATGVYTDIGDAAALTAALDNLIFTPTAHEVAPENAVTTTFTIGVNDGIAPTVTDSTTTVVTTATENPPTISGAVAGQTITDQAADRPFSGVTIGDVDSTAQTLVLTVTLSDRANGTLSNLGGGYYDAAAGVYTVSGTAAGLTAALDALIFTPTTHQVPAGSTVTTTFSIGVNDGVAPTVTNSTTSVIATGTTNTATGPTVEIVGADGLVSSGGSTRTVIVGTVSDNVAINSVTLYSDGTELGVATLAWGGAMANGDASWSFDASFAAGTFSDIVAVATDVDNHTSSAIAPFDLITGIAGSPYTSQEKTFNSAGLLVGRTYFNYDGSVYTAGTVERLPDGNVGYLYATGTAFEDQSYTSYESYFSSDEDEALYEGTTTNYTGISGQTYTGLSVGVDPYDRLTSQVFTGVAFQPFSSYEYEYVGGVYAGAQYDFTAVPNGASYSSYQTDYNFANAFVGDKFFFTNIQGQSYTGEEEDFDANGNLLQVLLTGVTDQAYTSLEEDYSAGVYEGYKAFYSITGKTYTGEEVDVSASNAITGVTYTGLTDAPYSSVQETYANGAVTSTTYDFTDQSGQDYYAYQVTKGANGAPLQEIVDNDDGSHSIVGYQSNQTFYSIGDDNFTGGGANETFVFQPVYGHDTINDFVSYLTGTGHDTISLSSSEFANVSAALNGTQDVDGSAVITAPNGDTITLVNVSEAMLSANPGDFTFHA
jgi:hypothetical protein